MCWGNWSRRIQETGIRGEGLVMFRLRAASIVLMVMAGCSKGAATPRDLASTSSIPPAHAQPAASTPTTLVGDPAPLPVISLGGTTPSATPPESATGSSDQVSEARQAAIAVLQPFQPLLGKWRGITRKEVSGDMQAIDEPEWVWDLRTDKARPALVMTTPKGAYYRQFRLTGAGPDRFSLVATDTEGRERRLEGTLAEPVEQFQEGGTTVQSRFKLLFEEEGDQKDRWQLAIAQQNNDRYLVELSRIRATGVQRLDTIGHQREGTSVAKSDTDYGERKCIISGGLGTTSVTYKGKTYWVCCSGCLAAFNDDPESWIRDAAKKGAP
jgi:hypothetical protein